MLPDLNQDHQKDVEGQIQQSVAVVVPTLVHVVVVLVRFQMGTVMLRHLRVFVDGELSAENQVHSLTSLFLSHKQE